MASSLSQLVHTQTDMVFFIKRMHNSVQSVVKTKGKLAAGMMVGTLTVSSVAAFGLSFFCLEGAVRSIIDVVDDQRSITRLRYLGDAGGWTSLAIFATLAVKSIYEKFIAEGEFFKIKEICQNWCHDNRNFIEETPKSRDAAYSKLNALFHAIQSRCLFSKSLASRRLIVLEIFPASPQEQQNENLNLDRRLEENFRNIQSDISDQISLRNYFQRLSLGHKKVRQKGCCNVSAARIFGVVFPIILMLNFMLSIVGEVGLGKELFVDREELTDIGHFGEWPINAIEAFAAAIFLNLWYLVNEGDLEITRMIYASHIEVLKENEDSSLHNRLCEIANEELAQIAATCDNLKLSEDYEFEKI